MYKPTRSWVSMIREITRLIAVLSCVVFVFAAFVPVASAAAGVPRIMNYQGRLMSSGGTLLGGSGTDYCVRFSLYDDATVGGPDTKLWPSGSPSTMTVVVRNGIFNAGVGDTGAGGDTLDFNFEDTDTAYLNVEVATKVGATCAPGDGAESFENLSPRQRVTATGYAINSATLNGRTGSFYQANSYSTTSAAYNLSTYDKGYFFSTTSVTYWDAQQYRWATTSTDAWFATKTTDALTEGSSNRYYSNTLVNSFVGASSTIAKAFTNNTFTGSNAFNGDVTLTNATTSNFSITNTIAGAGLVSCSGSSDKLIWNASTRQFGCGADAGAGGGITSLGAQYSVFQTGASQTLATSSDTNIGITITSSGDTHTFTPTWAGLLAAGRGGTGIGTVTQNGVLIGGAGNTWVQAATSSLGLPTYSDLSGYLTRADWYATTTDALAEGATNKYYQDSRVQTYLNGVNKGFFFSTTSASNFASVGLAFSTTSTDYWKSQTNFHSTSSFAFNLGTYDKGYFFSTTSVNYWDSTQSRWATTSSDAWFATKSTSNLPEGTNLYYTSNRVAGVIAGTTTDALAEGATNKYYSNGLVNSFIGSSSTIPKTFTNNTFTGTNAFGSVTAANATSTSLYTTFSSSTETRANTASFGSITAGSTTVAATSTTNGLFASFSRMLASFIDSLTASVLTAFTGTVGDLTATSSATLASTTAQGRFILGDLIATSTATSTIAGQLLIGTTSGSYKVSILGNTTGATGATGTAIVAISNNDNTLSSGNNVLRLNARTPFGTTCTTGTTCPRFTEYFTGVPSGSDTGGRGVGSLRLSAAGTGITQTSGAADFAEFMQLSESAAVGDIVSLNASGQYQKAIAGQSLIGVVSDNPAFVGNANLEGQTNAYIVGFAGVIQTTVSATNGTINAGDLIAASNVPGVGVKLTESGYALGQALQSFSGPGQGTITVLVMPKFVDAAVALESYGGGASGTSGYWDLSTSTNTVSLASSTYTVSIGTSASTSNLVVSNGFTFGKASGVLKSVAGVVSSSLVNLASDVTGVLGISNGGTGTSTVPGYGKILVGNGAGGYDLVSTSTLGTGSGSAVWGAITGTLSAQTDLQNALDQKFGLSQWYATTTDALAEGATNRYYQDSRVQTYLNGVNKGFFFSTTSASNFASVGLAFSTTSTDYWKSQTNFHSTSSFAFNLGTYDKGYFFSTTSVNYWDSTQSRWATTSSDAWLATKSTSNLPEGTNLYYTSNRVAGVIAGTTTDALAEGSTNKYYSNGLVQTYLNGVDKGFFFSTTSSDHWLTTKNVSGFSTSSANYYMHSSSTVPKTYTNNTYTGTNDFQNVTATGVTSTASFASTASSSNLFSAVANIGSLVSSIFTGNVITATNATTTNLYATFSSSTETRANTASFGSASVGSLSLGNALTGVNGGTGISSVTQNALLIGGPGNTWTQVATSSLGLVAFGDLGAYMGLAQWYATTTDALAEGSNNKYFTTNRVATVLAGTTTDALAEGATNRYYQDSRVQTYLNGVNKGFFFSTTSASNFASVGLAFSTTSTDYWKSQTNFHSTSSFAFNLGTYDKGYFFSTTSVNYWDSTQSRWATTSSDAWLATKSTSNLPEGTNLYYTSNRVAGVIAGTTTDALAEGSTNKYYSNGLVQTYLNGVDKGYFFSTTSAAYYGSQNPQAFSTSSANYYVNASSTIPKTYSNNTFTGTNDFQNLTATGVTSTASFATTASSSNLFSAAATIGSIIAKAVTGTVLTATNATTTTLYTDFASTTALNANTANVGSATVGSLTLGNALTGAHGGTGLNTVTQNALLIGGPGNTWTQVATSSLGLVAFGDLGAYMGLAQWYATTTDALAEGSNNRYFTTNRVAAVLAATTTDALAEGATNKYYQDSRVQTFLNTISKGYFFSTTSASNFAAAGLAFSTTSTDFWKSQNNFHSTSSFAYNLSTYDNGSFFSTTSVNYWESTKSRWATTSSDYWLSTKSTSDLPEGTNLYYTSNRVAGVIAGTTTDALAEGATNRYYQDSRVQTYLNGVNKGFFFSTTSSDYWKTQNNFFSTTSASVFSAAGLAFSTTSTDYWKSVNNFFSTTSASHFSSLGLAFSTTSASAFLAQNQGAAFSTTSASNFAAAGLAFSTTSANYHLSQNQGAAFSTTSANAYLQASTTAVAAYKNNTFTGTNSFQNITATGATTTSLSTGIASTTNLTISGIQNSLLYTGPGGIVAAAGITGPLSFSSGTLALALASSTASGYLSFTDWNSFNSRLSTTSLALFDKGYFFSTTSADAYITASTSIPKLSTNNTFIGVNAFANISATGATTTSFFTGTASSTNIFANVARFGSIGSFSLTGAVAAAANNITGINIASTTDLWISNIRNGLLATNGQGTVVASSTPTAASFNATSNTVASQLPYASTTAISALQQLSIGAANGTILQGAVAGTSTVAGFLNVTGTNSTSTFSGGVSFSRFNVTGTGTSTSAGGINITGGGCFSVNGLCIAAGAVNTVTATNTTLLVNPISGNVGIGLNLSNPNVWTGLQEFVYASSSLQEAAQFFAQTIQSTSTNALVLKSNLSSTAGLTFGSTSTPQVAAIDTINNRFTLGTGGANPSLLVLDTKNTGGDPTGVAGSMYYNSNIGAFRCFNASWVTCGGQAASSTGDVQFRNIDGSFTATSNFNWSMASNGLNLKGASSTQATDLLTISSSSNRTMFAVNGDGIITLATTSDPATPPSGELNIYAKEIAGRVMPKWIGPAGVDTSFQANLGFNRVILVTTAGAALSAQGATLTNVGTLSAATLAVNTLKQSVRRTTFTSAAGAGSLASSRSTTALVARGNATGIGGFFYTARFGLTTLQSGNRGFFGLSDSTAAATNVDPTTSNVIGKVGLAFNANTGNWKFVQNVAATAPAVIDLGASFPINTTDLLELVMYSKPNDTVINYRVTNLSTGAQIASSTGTTNIPANTTYLTIQEWMTNNATAAAVAFDLSSVYVESDN